MKPIRLTVIITLQLFGVDWERQVFEWCLLNNDSFLVFAVNQFGLHTYRIFMDQLEKNLDKDRVNIHFIPQINP